MLGLILLIAVGEAVSTRPDVDPGMYAYVQARNAFARARIFLQDRLPDTPLDANDPESRKHFNYGVLAGVTMNMVKAFHSTDSVYDPLRVLQETIPTVWKDYKKVAREVNNILALVQEKIQPITSLINTLCSTSKSVEACNDAIEEYILHVSKPYKFYRDRSKCLLKLGKAARTFNRQAELLDDIAAQNGAVPYLYKLVESTAYEVFIAELARVYEYLRHRGYNPYDPIRSYEYE